MGNYVFLNMLTSHLNVFCSVSETNNYSMGLATHMPAIEINKATLSYYANIIVLVSFKHLSVILNKQ